MKILKRDMENCGIKGFIFLFFLTILLPMVLSTCEEGQIDINSASLQDLDKLSGVGAVKAQAIIDSRPFNSVGDLIKVYGIGEATLEKIRQQGLACVADEKENKENQKDDKPEEEIEQEQGKDEQGKDEQEQDKIILPEEKTFKESRNVTRTSKSIIKLNSKNTESEVIYESKNEKIRIYAVYAFCLLLIFIIIILLRR